MSPRRVAIDANRIHKALDLDLELKERPKKPRRLSIEKESLVEDTDKMEIEKTSLTSSNDEYIASVVKDYQSDLDDLERSISEFREYLRKLKSKEKGLSR
jgi:hypothetical protein